MPAVLFGLTCLSTFWAGACQGSPSNVLAMFADNQEVLKIRAAFWGEGLTYMLAVMAILLAYELGHFIQAVRNHVPASFPMFIPMPLTPLGTMGAVIAMQGGRADRRQLFDIGITGPLAGLIVAIPIAWMGIARAVPENPLLAEPIVFENPLLMQVMVRWLRPGMPGDQTFLFDPLLRAAWVGMLITGLNMLPISQLDGGHVAYALFGRRSRILAWGVVAAAVIFMVLTSEYIWVVMLLVVIAIGVSHRPTADDSAPLGLGRRIIGALSLTIPLFCFHPHAIREIG